MSKVRARDRVTVAFHYFNIKIESDGDEPVYEGFDQYQIEEFKERLENLPPLDIKNDQIIAMLRNKTTVPIEHIEKIDDRTYFGKYRGAYWGHGYENTHAGYIPPESISLRPFYFLIYFSTDGKIYVGCQYLGQFGSYTGLKNSLIRIFKGDYVIAAHSFRSEASDLENVVPREVRITVASASANKNKDNSSRVERLTVLKTLGRGTETTAAIKASLIKHHKQPEKLREKVSDILRKNDLISFADDDIVDCVVVAEVDGRPFVLHYGKDGVKATQFELKKVTYEDDGHPNRVRVRDGSIKILEDKILSKSEDA